MAERLGFPIPFGGIDRLVRLDDVVQLIDALYFMGRGCNGLEHRHNIAVQFDATYPAIWTTELGGGCLTRFLAQSADNVSHER